MVASTYRLQLRREFDLHAAAGLAGYLANLGVTHLYSSPLLAATSGSEHGYDVVDHSHVDGPRGGEEGRRALAAALRQHRLGLVVDLVPNHVGVSVPAENPAWWDLLRLGPQSVYARWFDVDWSWGRVLLPVLADGADPLSDLRIENGQLRYVEHRFPLAIGTERLSPRDAHQQQHYELVSWRRADTDHNYRRFFAISGLAAVRVEDPVVFEATHAEPLRWLAAGDVDGLRIDHPDGLTDPTGYLRELRLAADAAAGRPAWLVVEKILEPGEELPADWPVDGTTGYDALAEVDGVLVDPAAEPAFTALDETLTGVRTSWPDLVHDCKLEVTHGLLQAELRRLAVLAADVADAPAALAELLACFPVYRSYLPTGQEHLRAALAEAARRRPELTGALSALAPRLREPSDPLAVRFQQTSGAVMAKGVEDTAYYRWTRFVVLNEVGGDPARFGLPVEAFHAALARRQQHWPAGMTALSTHDTKRAEDVRARLFALAEIPDEWTATVARWMELARPPDGALGHLLCQTVVGAWPISRQRLHRYVEKAAREAGTRTGWRDPAAVFEAAIRAAVDAVYDQPALRADVEAVAGRIDLPGWSNSLSLKLLQLTMPGVPDVYQGTELWDYSLVDPDNRRPVNFGLRRELLDQIDRGWLPPLDRTGAAKLLVTSRALRLRRDRPGAFASYAPLHAAGPAAGHAVAFDRGGAVTVATRLPVRLGRDGGWQDTTLPLPPGDWTDVLTGARLAADGPVPLADLLARYPVALLCRDEPDQGR